MTDYIGAAMAKPSDLLQYGRKGMKWGQRIFSDRGGSGSSKGTADNKASAAKSESSSGSAPAKRPPGNIQDNVESSSARYDRLAGAAKAGRAHEMTEQDLKFFNARTEALSKINKMNEEKPSWLRETATKVIQQSAQRQMQTVADALADKYVGDPIKEALKGAVPKASDAAKKSADTDTPSVTTTATSDSTTAKSTKSFKDVASAAASKAADSVAASKRAKGDKQYEETKKKIAESEARKASDPSEMNVTESIRYYKDNPSSNPTPPAGLSPNGYRLWLEEIKRS